MATKRTANVAVVRASSRFLLALTIVVIVLGVAQVAAAGQAAAAPTMVEFLPAMNYDTGGRFASSVAIADLNGDGNPDLVVTNVYGKPGGSPSVIGVLMGNGNGTFQPVAIYISGGGFARSVAVADVNADGKLDLVIANETGGVSCPNGAVDVLEGNGDGTFRAAVEFCSGGSTPLSVAVRDVNGDGKPDIVVANAGSDNLGVLIGKGDGTFQPAVSYGTLWPGPVQVAIADVNGDHKPDLVAADLNTIPSFVSVLLGNGDGTFQAAVTYPSGANYAAGIAVADVNGDGFPDLLVANERACANCQNGSLDVLLGNGDGTFQPAVGYSSGGNGAMAIAVADVNGDGKPDLVAANYESNNLGVLIGNGDGTFQAALIYASGGSGPIAIAVADVNRDAKPDLVAANWYGNGNNVGLAGVLLNNTPFCTAAPLITVSVSPKFLWPPNGKMVPVTASGTVRDADVGCMVKTADYAVTDEYGVVQPRGRVTWNSAGAYTFTIWLQASRLGADRDGRSYNVTVRASNNTGKTASKVAKVVVPHDQR